LDATKPGVAQWLITWLEQSSAVVASRHAEPPAQIGSAGSIS
jgi:hypothetical protein